MNGLHVDHIAPPPLAGDDDVRRIPWAGRTPRGPREPLSAERLIWRALGWTFLLVFLVSIAMGLHRELFGGHFQPANVPISVVTSRNPAVCGVEHQPTSVVLKDGGEPKIYTVNCDDGVTVYDWERG